MSKQQTIQIRQGLEKEALLQQLKKIPIVQVACEKAGVSRATYYRWRKDDEDFRKESNTALREGKELMNDLAESQLLTLIKNGHATSIFYWLNHNHKSYTNKLQVTAKLQRDEKLTPDEEEAVMRAISMAKLLPSSIPDESSSKTE